MWAERGWVRADVLLVLLSGHLPPTSQMFPWIRPTALTSAVKKRKKKKKTHNSVLSACEHANVSYFDPETAVVLVLLYNSYYLWALEWVKLHLVTLVHLLHCKEPCEAGKHNTVVPTGQQKHADYQLFIITKYKHVCSGETQVGINIWLCCTKSRKWIIW